MTAETWREQTCPDDAPDGRCWDCRAPSSEPHKADCPRAPVARYTAAVIYCCPECWGDLEHEGADSYWCRACARAYHFTQVMLQDDTDYDRD